MRYIHFYGDAGYCGTDYHYFEEYPDGTSDGDIECDSDTYRQENSEGYEYLATGWDDDFEDEADREAYYDGACGHWDELSKEEWEAEKEYYGVG